MSEPRPLRFAHRGCLFDEGRVAFEGSGPRFEAIPTLRALLEVGRDWERSWEPGQA